MHARQNAQRLAELLERLAQAWVTLDGIEADARRAGFGNKELDLAKKQVAVLKSDVLASMQEEK